MKKKSMSFLSFFHLRNTTKQKLKRLLPGTISTVIVLAVVVLTVFHSTDGFTTIVDTEPASLVTERDYMSFSAYILKNEETLSSQYSGGVYYLADNAQKVNPGDPLALVYKNGVDEKTEALASEIDRYIDLLEESIGDGVFTLGESKDVKNSISKVYYEMMRAVTNGNSSVISSGADEFLILLNKMNLYSGNGDKLKEMLGEYKEKRENIKDQYTGDHQNIVSEKGGYFFHGTDGYEAIFSSVDIDSLTYDSFQSMLSEEPTTDKFVGKLMTDFRWYLVIPTVKGISDTYSVGSTYDVTFPESGNRTLKMDLYNVLPDATGAKALMVFSCGIIDGSFDYLRVQDVNITHRNVSGYRVPVSAVCDVGGNTGVYILKDGMASFRKITILFEGDGYYIASSDNSNSSDYFIYLEPNDNIITDCKNMYEGKVIGG